MADRMLEGRRIIVTGGASGMGEGLVRALPAMGARIVSLDLNADAGARVAGEAGATFLAVDVTDKASVDAATNQAVAALDGLDVLIHAAGIAPGAPAESIPQEQWLEAIAVNATGTFLVNQAVFPHLKDRGGAIINFASAAGIKGYPGKAAYAAAKGAVVAWVRSIASEWGRYNIRVNAIAPTIWTPMYDKTRSSMSTDQLAAHDAALKIAIPIGGKLGDIGRDLVPVVAFLASDGAHFMTGQIIPVDGGALMMR
ncbi:SDR family NAD(P)-dependent oxidoreductase [Sphingomonas koreensis]|jgi:NAD(P)-dependent dehydrogenase (short-subunit alcohol dehydrogenase family)|uniref:SDR family oxidoreductase n=1 Tax=Sphingomonas koreensis TaxID=93064 RepID=A0A1L6J5A5_9SPHN|nr:SDR family oxidoreductase [Sphingomonas koreensis]APR51068.1 short-chain dehydrogenase [Sphingomonas koreensis]MDC7810648.1 SDR family oxidoreductase [Sphingomonas koreensis]RSU17179.1 SDR family NAD(P)-dependent oxidoreductase [Sphingomonas koreensis]RSU19512.1 SDR family NAD(P)-dependent oxidoreductase [Sphingomonas koreensis]RSU20927.1 SDR family NAD(P)-dependent oxidoreductase [Sphingomonas koreensis]